MNKITKAGISVAALGVVVLLGATTVFASHAWGSYHWARTANPFTIKMGDNVSSTWDSYLATASADWSASSVLDTVVVTGQGGSNCKATTGRIEVCNRKYGYNGWIGLAQIWINGSHITKGTAKMNDSYFNLPQYNNPDEKLHVMCQEVGHLFGLGHTSEDGSSQSTCMDYSSSPNSTKPNHHDYDQLAAIYSHLDGSTTIAQSTASSGADTDSNDPKAWGKEIYRSSNGRVSIFEQDLGHGERTLRHVYWAEDRARNHRE